VAEGPLEMNAGSLDHRLALGRSSGLSQDTHGDAFRVARIASRTTGRFSGIASIAPNPAAQAAGMPSTDKTTAGNEGFIKRWSWVIFWVGID